METITTDDIKAIERGARAALRARGLTIEVAVRAGVNGIPTVDSTLWDDGSDLDQMMPLAEVAGLIRDWGKTLDLYCWWQQGGRTQLRNLDAQWTGTEWKVFDPFTYGTA